MLIWQDQRNVSTFLGTVPALLAADAAGNVIGATTTGDVAIAPGSMAATIQPHVVSYAKMQQASTHILLGNPTAGTADLQEITLGTNLSFSGSVLNAAGGGITQLTGDVIAGPGSGSQVATLVNIPNDTRMAGDLLATAISGPFPPGAGKGRIWFDSTSNNLWAIDGVGVTTHTVKTQSPIPSNFLTAIAANGTVSLAQPAFTDISGTVAAAQLGSFANGSVLFWNSGLAQDNANFSYDSAAHTLSLLGSTPIAFGTGTQTIGKTSGTLAFATTGAGSFTFSPNSTLTLSLTTAGAVRVNSLVAGGMVSAVAASGQLAIAVAGTDYQAPVTWPTANQVLVSQGTTLDPLGDSTFTFDRVIHVMAGGNAIGINGATVPSSASLVVGNTNNTNRDRVKFLVGGGTLGASGTSDSTLFDINPSATVITAGVTAGIYATQRIRAVSYSGPGTTITEAATVYIDGPPSLGGFITSGGPYALHVASGVTLLGGNVKATSLVAGGIVATDATGLLQIAGTGGVPAAVSGEQHYYVNVAGSTLVTGGAVWLGTSSTAGQGGTALEYVHHFAAITAALDVRIITNAITSGSLAVQITRNGASFSTITLTSTSTGTLTTGTVTVGSPLASDRWGALVSGSGTGMSGNMVFTATLLLAPNVF